MSDSHALRILELDAALALVGGRAATELGASHIRALRPRFDRGALEREHARVAGMRAMLGSDEGWPSEPIPDLRESARITVLWKKLIRHVMIHPERMNSIEF